MYSKREDEVNDYIKREKERREERVKEAREAGALIECQCCYSDECLEEDMLPCQVLEDIVLDLIAWAKATSCCPKKIVKKGNLSFCFRMVTCTVKNVSSVDRRLLSAKARQSCSALVSATRTLTCPSCRKR